MVSIAICYFGFPYNSAILPKVGGNGNEIPILNKCLKEMRIDFCLKSNINAGILIWLKTPAMFKGNKVLSKL